MIVLGVDPGFRSLGYCVVRLRTARRVILARGTLGCRRGASWTGALPALVKTLARTVGAWQPAVVAVESITWVGPRRGALALAHLAGAVGGQYASTAQVVFFPPHTVKRESARGGPPRGWNAHEVDALSLCKLAARATARGRRRGVAVVARSGTPPTGTG